MSNMVRWILLAPVILSLAVNRSAADDDVTRSFESSMLGSAPLEPGETEFEAQPDEDCNIVISARDNSPLLVLNTGGPRSTVRAIEFSPDSERMYTGGLDKTVQVWGFRIGERGIRRTAQNRAILTQTLRWEIARGPNGFIYAMAASPVNRELAIAGLNARSDGQAIGGDIVIYDTARGEVLRVLHKHDGPIVSVCYSPSGKRVASAGRNGQVIVWSEEDNGQGSEIREAGDDIGVFVPIAFLDEDHLLIPIQNDAKGKSVTWSVNLFDVRAPKDPPKVLPQVHQNAVTCLAVDPVHGRFASADITESSKGNVYIWSGGADPKPETLRLGRLALSADFDPAGHLFLSSGLYTYADGSSQSALEMWDVEKKAMVDQVEVSKREHAVVCRVSPDGGRVTTYSADEGQLRVYLLKDRQGNAIEKPFQTKPFVVQGNGRPMLSVAFADGPGYKVGFRTELSSKTSEPQADAIREGFDLAAMKSLKGADLDGITWRTSQSGFERWSCSIEDAGQKVVIKNGDETWSEIGLRARDEGLAVCYAFLGSERGGQPFAVAVGTAVNDRILVYAIKGKDEPTKLVRHFRGHGGTVTGLSASPDGKYLASSSTDQTISVWSLDGLQTIETRFGASQAWGASFLFEDGQIVARGVREAGTAARKGIREGDVIRAARFVPALQENLGRPTDEMVTDPRQLLRGLESTKLTDLVLLTLERRGSRLNRQVLIMPAWSPVLSLFVGAEGEWAAFTPQGYYDSSVAGDELFGWQMNRGGGVKPDFYRADQFRRQLERPAAMRQLLSLGTIQQALRLTDDAPAAGDAVLNAVRETPTITIISPTDAQELAAPNVPLVARVEYPSASAAEKIGSVAYVNGVPGELVSQERQGTSRVFQWSADAADTYNRLRVVAADESRETVAYADVHFRLRGELAGRRPRLHMFLLAAAEYEHVAQLAYPVQDAKAIVEVLKQQSGDLYDPGEVKTLYNADISREQVVAAIEDWKKTLADARSDDLLVVFMAGHGLAVEGEYYFVPTNVEGAEGVAQVGVPWSTWRTLGDIGCRKLFLLDTCHSGNVLPIRQALAENWKQAIRPLKQEEMIVIAATDVGQEALEIQSLGHGVFTQTLLDGFAGAADDQDDKAVDLEEIAQYVEREVPLRTRSLQLQTPRSYPADLMRAISVPLVTVR